MLGEDTLVLTHRGFKKVRDLIIYDELLTRYGTFEPVVELGPWKNVDKVVTLSSGEQIYCSDDLLWGASKSSTPEYYSSFVYTDEFDLENNMYNCNDTLEMEGDKKSSISNAYELGVVVPDRVPDEVILADLETRLAFMAGLIDSQICELRLTEGSYAFYTNYIDLATSIITLARSIEWGARLMIVQGVYRVDVYMTKYIDALPIRDEYKLFSDYVDKDKHIKINNIETVENSDIMGRTVRVNGGALLIGYSLVPVS